MADLLGIGPTAHILAEGSLIPQTDNLSIPLGHSCPAFG